MEISSVNKIGADVLSCVSELVVLACNGCHIYESSCRAKSI